ncbi:acyltransferase family protein [Sphingomonas sp. HMP6]|uniref:acyltransferase family protein n=1 Tax=Sphingomonas sp. HMP6 TaxID=1517551 RepID=UPI001596C4A3|nr:acyltransferase family protein [Sphingomonas sp. HMP6]BCA59639.1 membrane protein [Sphingomonas sp. HMP6]
MERHFGLDWLRIGAFGLLIFYHIGMVFVPWGYHVKTAQPQDWVVLPMLALNSWRLLLLFVVSGYASRALLAKGSGTAGFAANRTARLIVPLLFGMLVVVPVQPWIELTTQRGYTHDFGYFLLHDYFRFGNVGGVILPTWQHLWFVAYLWSYTMILVVLVALFGRLRLQVAFDRVFGTILVWLIPAAWLIVVSAWLFPGIGPTNTLVNDLVSHAQYLPGFLFGFALAGSPSALAAMRRWWPWALGVGLLCYGVVVAIEIEWPGSTTPAWPWGILFAAARAVQGWSIIVALIGLADTYLNRDHRWRRMLTEAVFPFYIIHQTIIVGVEGALLPLALSPVVEFLILLTTTVGGCWAFYAVGREIGWLRPLIGLRPFPRTKEA